MFGLFVNSIKLQKKYEVNWFTKNIEQNQGDFNRALLSITHISFWEPYFQSPQEGSKVGDPHQLTIQHKHEDLTYLTVGGSGINSNHCSLFLWETFKLILNSK